VLNEAEVKGCCSLLFAVAGWLCRATTAALESKASKTRLPGQGRYQKITRRQSPPNTSKLQWWLSIPTQKKRKDGKAEAKYNWSHLLSSVRFIPFYGRVNRLSQQCSATIAVVTITSGMVVTDTYSGAELVSTKPTVSRESRAVDTEIPGMRCYEQSLCIVVLSL
jgi:hypothetical protein